MMRGSRPRASISIRSAECRHRSRTCSNRIRLPTYRVMVARSRGWLRWLPALGGLLDGQSAGGDIRVPWSPPNSPSSPGSTIPDTPTRRQSRLLGGVAPPAGGATGGAVPHPDLSGRQRPSVRHDGQPRLLVTNGRTAVEFPFVVYKPTW